MKALTPFSVWRAARRTLESKPVAYHRAAVPLVAALVICGLAGSGPQLARGITPATLAPSAPVPPVAPPAPSTLPPAKLASPGGQEIDALVGAVTRKYHVSRSAARDFVAIAYHEGWRLGVDPVLVVAVMAVESGFNPVAESDGGAVGLMQVIPRFHEEKLADAGGVSALDPRLNIQLGTRVLKEYIQRGGTEVAGLQLYNGASGDPSNAYAVRVLREKQRLWDAIRRGDGPRTAAENRAEARVGA